MTFGKLYRATRTASRAESAIKHPGRYARNRVKSKALGALGFWRFWRRMWA